MKLTILLTILLPFGSVAAQDFDFHVDAHLLFERPVRQQDLFTGDYDREWKWYDKILKQSIVVPTTMPFNSHFGGILTGFRISSQKDGKNIQLDSLTFTEFSFSVFRISPLGVKTAVAADDGTPYADVSVLSCTESTEILPSVEVSNEVFSSTNPNEIPFTILCEDGESLVGQTFENFATMTSTEHYLKWNFCEDFTYPKENETYLVEWNIKADVTHEGVTYENLSIELNDHPITFSFRVEEILPPKMTVDFVSSDEFNFIELEGEYLDFVSIRTSTDLQDWDTFREALYYDLAKLQFPDVPKNKLWRVDYELRRSLWGPTTDDYMSHEILGPNKVCWKLKKRAHNQPQEFYKAGWNFVKQY